MVITEEDVEVMYQGLVVPLEAEANNPNVSWADLTLDQVDLIKDRKRQFQSQRSIQRYMRHKISTLVFLQERISAKKRKRFEFSKPENELTCRLMYIDLLSFLLKNGMTMEEIDRELLPKEKTESPTKPSKQYTRGA